MNPSPPVDPAPKLQPPGAGLPWWEGAMTRYVLLPLLGQKLDWAGASKLFQKEGAKVLALWDALPAGQLEKRVLVKRLQGMEDSSRHWSTAMTVEHLNIVGAGIRALINGLRQGELPTRKTRVEDVKPRGEKPPAVVRAEFAQLLADAAAGAESEPPVARGQGPRAPHPWFGPLDACQWHLLLAVHQQIHRKQIEGIAKGL